MQASLPYLDYDRATRRLRLDPHESAFVQNPYRFYGRARKAGPLFFWHDYGLVCATSATVVGAILRDRRFGREGEDALFDALRTNRAAGDRDAVRLAAPEGHDRRINGDRYAAQVTRNHEELVIEVVRCR